MPAFRRLELWSNLQCAAGTRQAIAVSIAELTETRSVTGPQSLSALLMYDATLMALLVEWKVLRVVYQDDTFDEWRITEITEARDNGEPMVAVTGAWPSIDLASLGIITRTETDGLVRPDFEALGLSPAAHLSTYILPALAAEGATWFAAGTITPTAPVDVIYAWQTPQQAIDLLASSTQTEFQLRRNGTSQYLIDLVDAIGSSAATVRFRAGRNLAGVKRSRSAVALTTRAFPKGAAEDGVAATMARARWKVTAVDTGTDDVTLADPVGGDGPILFDDQFNGKYLRRVSGTLDAIVDTFVATQKIRVADASFYTVNDLVQLRKNSSGDDLIFLDSPAGIAGYGGQAKVAVLERPDIPGTVNLCPNPAQRAWAGGSSVPADSWAKVGTCTVTKTTTATRTRVGGQSTRVQTAADGAGIEVNNGAIVPTTTSPYFSGYVSLQIASGQVRLELVVSDGSTTWVIPSGTENKAWSNVIDVWVDLGVAGIDLKALGTGCITARLRVVQDGAASADFYVDSAQITQSAGQLPFIEGSGGTQLWQEANRLLEREGTPEVRLDVDILDLERLNPGTWSADALVLGQTAEVYDGELGVIVTTRALEYTRDLLTEADTKCVLSNRPEDLTDALVRPTRARRLVRDVGIGAVPVITPYYSKVNGTPFQASVSLQATPPGCTIYKWVGLSSDTVPIAGSASYSTYASPVTVNLAASAVYNAVIACYAVIGNRQSPVTVFQLPLSPEPLAPVTLSEPVGGTLRISWAPNAWVRRVHVYRRQHATNWPTLDNTETGTPDPAYRVADMSIAAFGGGTDGSGNAIAGGTQLENTGWTTSQVARVVVVPIDELDNVGTAGTASRTMTGSTAPALTSASQSANSPGANCGAGCTRDISWTPNAGVVNSTHRLDVYVDADGTGEVLLFSETSPQSVTSHTAVAIGSPNGISSYGQGSGTKHTFVVTYKLIKVSDSSVLDAGTVGFFYQLNTCA